MDIAELLDVTQPVEVSLAGKTVTCQVYSAGWATRLTLDDLATVEPLRDEMGNTSTRMDEIEGELKLPVTDERRESLKKELVDLKTQNLKASARFASIIVPFIVKSAQIDGEPFIYNGLSFAESVPKLPASFIMAIASKAGDLEANPTTPDLSESGSGLGEIKELDQPENMPA